MTMTLEALVMVGLMAAAVWIAFTKLACPQASEDARIAWLPNSLEDIRAEEEAPGPALRR